jgi:hypothetical protein
MYRKNSTKIVEQSTRAKPIKAYKFNIILHSFEGELHLKVGLGYDNGMRSSEFHHCSNSDVNLVSFQPFDRDLVALRSATVL